MNVVFQGFALNDNCFGNFKMSTKALKHIFQMPFNFLTS